MLILVIFVAIAFLTGQGSQEVPSPLSMSITRVEQTSCRLTDDSFIVEFALTTRYTNVTPRPVRVVDGAEWFGHTTVARGGGALDATTTVEVFDGDHLLIRAIESSRDTIRTVNPGESLQGAIRPIVIVRDPVHENAGSGRRLSVGDYWFEFSSHVGLASVAGSATGDDLSVVTSRAAPIRLRIAPPANDLKPC